jgi:glycerophosphoryl diester phosphodiesterase
MRRHVVLDGAPLLIAHRGGSGLAPENTLAAFLEGAGTWGADMIELDVHASADGHCVVFHDDTVDRTTDGSGPVAGMTLTQLRELDAGYRFTRDGVSYPYRGRGVGISTFDEVLEALPTMRFTVEVKVGAAQAPLFAAIRRHDATHRVIAAGMNDRDRTQFSGYRGAVSASAEELRRFYFRYRMGLGRFFPPRADVVQVPEEWGDRRIVTPGFVRALRARGIPVHVWTVDARADMKRLLEWGVEGIVTDRPDVLGMLLHEEYGRPLSPGHAAAADG